MMHPRIRQVPFCGGGVAPDIRSGYQAWSTVWAMHQRAEMDTHGAAADFPSRFEALNVDPSNGSETPSGTSKGDGKEEERRAHLGPDERRRLTVAAMSPEDIVLCVDEGSEMGCEWANAGPGGAPASRMRVVQAALSGYVRRKSTFNQRHRFALCALGDGVRVVRSMTSDIRRILEGIEQLQPGLFTEDSDEEETPFDFTELLDCISERFPPPNSAKGSSAGGGGSGVSSRAGLISQIRPVVRAVVVYGRSYTCPVVPPVGESKPPLLSHERFFLDCVYLHRKPSEEGVVCQEAFDLIAGMETCGGGSHSYFLECGHNLQRFNANMASLLAHPVQRDYQEDFFDKLDAGGRGEMGSKNRSPPRGGPQSGSVASGASSGGGSASP